MTTTVLTLGVLTDTHIPDRLASLPAEALQIFREAQVHAILHAGDATHPTALQSLTSIAPVFTVQGNADWRYLRNWRLPTVRFLRFGGFKIILTHGHGSLRQYLLEKWIYFRKGMHHLPLERYQNMLEKRFGGQSDVVIFGHTHRTWQRVVAGQLYFNPGGIAMDRFGAPPRVGLLHLSPTGIQVNVVDLSE